MLFYIRCPSCGRVISYEMDKFFEGMNSIRNNPKLTKQERDAAGAELLKQYPAICCRIRMLGVIPAHEIINS